MQATPTPTRARSSAAIRHQNDVDGLTHIHNFGLLRLQELGRLMWSHHIVDGVRRPNNRAGFPQACRAAQSWLVRGLVIERSLPGGRGRALVLSQAGAAFLTAKAARTGIPLSFPARSGKDIGDMVDGVWMPPASWQHDLMSHGVLVRLAAAGSEIWPENQIRRDGRWSGKIPDGLVRGAVDGTVFWFETERAEKTGRGRGAALAAVAETLILASQKRLPEVLGMRPTQGVVVFDMDARDSRGHRIDHRLRVETALQLQCKAPIQVAWLACELEHFGVKAVTMSTSYVAPDPGLRVAQVLNAHGWRKVEGPQDVVEVYYSGHHGLAGIDAAGGAYFRINGGAHHPAANLTDAKKGVATAFAVLTGLR